MCWRKFPEITQAVDENFAASVPYRIQLRCRRVGGHLRGFRKMLCFSELLAEFIELTLKLPSSRLAILIPILVG